MPLFILRVNHGYGTDDFEIIESKDQDSANNEAYQMWLDGSDQDYDARPYSDEEFDNLNLEDDYGLERPDPVEPTQ